MDKKDTIIELRKNNLTYREIGEKFGISRQRVYQIITGYKSPENRPISIFNKKVIEFSEINNSFNFLQKGIAKSINGGRDRHREIIRIRDNHTCQICGKVWIGGRKFDVHHLDCDKRKTKQCDNLETEKDNLITLCHKCHLNLPEHKKKTQIIFLPKYNKWKIKKGFTELFGFSTKELAEKFLSQC